MRQSMQAIGLILIGILSVYPNWAIGQQVGSVVAAFDSLNVDPQVFQIKNSINVPTQRGHLQGIQMITLKGTDKLMVSGSSQNVAYLLQIDVENRRSERLITLMTDPYRHAGGIQVCDPYLAVGIEDNFLKTSSKVCLYNYKNNVDFDQEPNLIIQRRGLAKRYTAGTTGLLDMEDHFLVLVSNWDSRIWEFYKVTPSENEQELLLSFEVDDDWPSYQSINLVKDSTDIFAVGTYQKGTRGVADLVHISKVGLFAPSIKMTMSKLFNTRGGVDFSTAAGIQVDSVGRLHIWATQRDASDRITINRFSQE